MEAYTCSWIGRINIIKMTILLKAIYIFNAILIKNINDIFHKSRSSIPKIYMEPKKIPNSLSNLEKEEQSERITIPDIKLYYKATVIKTAWYWHKIRHIDQDQNREHRNKLTFIWSINI